MQENASRLDKKNAELQTELQKALVQIEDKNEELRSLERLKFSVLSSSGQFQDRSPFDGKKSSRNQEKLHRFSDDP